jgi:hypothetical protein
MVDFLDLKIGDAITISKSLHLDRKKKLIQSLMIDFKLPWWNRSNYFYIAKKEHFITRLFYYLYSKSKESYVCGTDNRQCREMIKEISKLSPFNTLWLKS